MGFKGVKIIQVCFRDGTQKRVWIRHGKRAIRVRVIESLLYNYRSVSSTTLSIVIAISAHSKFNPVVVSQQWSAVLLFTDSLCRAKRKSVIEHAQNVRINVILCMCMVSSGPLLSIDFSVESSDFVGGQPTPWSDCEFAQFDLGLCSPHMLEDTFSPGAAQLLKLYSEGTIYRLLILDLIQLLCLKLANSRRQYFIISS